MKLKKGKFLGAIVLSLFLLTSCRSLKNTNTLFLSEYDKFADTAKTVYIANASSNKSEFNFVIKPFDLISIRNLQNPEGIVVNTNSEGVQSAAVFRVERDGSVNLPVVGVVELKGLNQDEAGRKIQSLYGKTLLRNPIIELKIVNYKVTLFGETAKPGNYVLDRENIDLIELLGKSGGLLPSSDSKKIKIIRGNRKSPEIIYVNLRDLKSLSSDKLILQNNDIIYIPPQGIYNLSEGIKSYSAIIQPVFIVLNAVLLIYTLGR